MVVLRWFLILSGGRRSEKLVVYIPGNYVIYVILTFLKLISLTISYFKILLCGSLRLIMSYLPVFEL